MNRGRHESWRFTSDVGGTYRDAEERAGMMPPVAQRRVSPDEWEGGWETTVGQDIVSCREVTISWVPLPRRLRHPTSPASRDHYLFDLHCMSCFFHFSLWGGIATKPQHDLVC